MGTFEGHALPGSFFLAFGIWWCMKYSYRLIRKNSNVSRQKNGTTANNSKWGRRLGRCHGLSAEFVEGIVVVMFTIAGFISEQSWPYKKWAMFDKNDPNKRFVHGAEWQHCTMYMFFGIAGAVQILARTCVCGLKEFDKFFLALAYFVEGLLFYFHVHGRTPLDVSLHYMLVIAVMLTVVVTVAELWKGDDPLLPFLRSGLTITQGTWFWQVGFMLYPPNGVQWDEDNHPNMMFATMAFCWHIAASILVMAGVYGIVSLCQRSKGVYLVPYKQVDDEYQVGLMSLDDKGSSDNE